MQLTGEFYLVTAANSNKLQALAKLVPQKLHL